MKVSIKKNQIPVKIFSGVWEAYQVKCKPCQLPFGVVKAGARGKLRVLHIPSGLFLPGVWKTETHCRKLIQLLADSEINWAGGSLEDLQALNSNTTVGGTIAAAVEYIGESA